MAKAKAKTKSNDHEKRRSSSMKATTQRSEEKYLDIWAEFLEKQTVYSSRMPELASLENVIAKIAELEAKIAELEAKIEIYRLKQQSGQCPSLIKSSSHMLAVLIEKAANLIDLRDKYYAYLVSRNPRLLELLRRAAVGGDPPSKRTTTKQQADEIWEAIEWRRLKGPRKIIQFSKKDLKRVISMIDEHISTGSTEHTFGDLPKQVIKFLQEVIQREESSKFVYNRLLDLNIQMEQKVPKKKMGPSARMDLCNICERTPNADVIFELKQDDDLKDDHYRNLYCQALHYRYDMDYSDDRVNCSSEPHRITIIGTMTVTNTGDRDEFLLGWSIHRLTDLESNTTGQYREGKIDFFQGLSTVQTMLESFLAAFLA